jgi:hypothetical protein
MNPCEQFCPNPDCPCGELREKARGKVGADNINVHPTGTSFGRRRRKGVTTARPLGRGQCPCALQELRQDLQRD